MHRLVEILFQIGLEEREITPVPAVNELLVDVTDFEVDLWVAICHGDRSKGTNVPSADTSHHQLIIAQLLEEHLQLLILDALNAAYRLDALLVCRYNLKRL